MSDTAATTIQTPTQLRHVALVGNPNTGKSTLFNALTGYHQRVGNFPGVTVDKRTAVLAPDGASPPIEVIDLPGAYSLAANARDEAVVLDVLLNRLTGVDQLDLIVVVVDASHLGRNLFFTTQILEIGKPVVIALNMMDVAEEAGLRIDTKTLSQLLGVPVVAVVATKQRGIESLRQAIVASLDASPPEHYPDFPACVCAEWDGLTKTLSNNGHDPGDRASRVEALQTLLMPGGYHEQQLIRRYGRSLADELAVRRKRIEEAGESLIEVEARVRYAWIDRMVKQVVTRARAPRRSRSDVADRILTHRLFGLVFLFVILGFCFQAIYTWAVPLMNAIGGTFTLLGNLVGRFIPPGPLESLIADGVLAGVGAVLTFLPQILILFLFIAILEDCGYMARAAFLLDRWMGLLGLNGKSFIPLVSSFACAVPAIMATRTIENRRDRFLTILIAPLMSCSARLPVYVVMIAAFIPAKPLLGRFLNLQALTLLCLYLLGVVVAVMIALILTRTVMKGKTSSFLMELPSYKWPSWRTVFYRVYEQGREFCATAGSIIFAVVIIIWALGYYPHPTSIAARHDALRAAAGQRFSDHQESIARASQTSRKVEPSSDPLQARLGEIAREESGSYLRQSYLGRLGRCIEPVVKPLGWDWRIGTAVVASFPAREVVIATMGTIYNLGSKQNEHSTGLREELRRATWPDGKPVYNTAVALSIMVFFALCCQCGGTLAVIKRETHSWRWPLVTFTYMTTLAYVGALATYQITMHVI